MRCAKAIAAGQGAAREGERPTVAEAALNFRRTLKPVKRLRVLHVIVQTGAEPSVSGACVKRKTGRCGAGRMVLSARYTRAAASADTAARTGISGKRQRRLHRKNDGLRVGLGQGGGGRRVMAARRRRCGRDQKKACQHHDGMDIPLHEKPFRTRHLELFCSAEGFKKDGGHSARASIPVCLPDNSYGD
jgi:hypothetical protein